jgi:hypothetical protein
VKISGITKRRSPKTILTGSQKFATSTCRFNARMKFDAKPEWLCDAGIGKEPDSGRYNLSLAPASRSLSRACVRGANQIRRPLDGYMNRYSRHGPRENAPLGGGPIWRSAIIRRSKWRRVPNSRRGVDEYEFAGGWMDSAVRVTPSATLGEGFLDCSRAIAEIVAGRDGRY